MINKGILDQESRIAIKPEDFSEERDPSQRKGQRDQIGGRLQEGKRSNCGRDDPYDHNPPEDRQTSSVLKKRCGKKCK